MTLDALLRPELATLKAYVPHPCPPDAVRLDANESPWALDDATREHLAETLRAVPLHRYPDVRATALREAIAAREDCHPDQIVLGSGSDEVIALVQNALSRPRPGRASATVLAPRPSFVMYGITARTLGLVPAYVDLDPQRWDLSPSAITAAIDAWRPNVTFLPSPNNPTGNLLDGAALDAAIAASDGLVVLDEAYGAFAGVTYRDRRKRHGHVAQLQTLSKVGLAAIRVGWAILPPRVAAAVEKVRQPYNLNALSQAVATRCLTDLAPALQSTVDRVVAARADLAVALGDIDGVRVDRSDANFLWVELPVETGPVHAALAARGVLVRSFHADPSLVRRMRITVGTPEECRRCVEALRAVL